MASARIARGKESVRVEAIGIDDALRKCLPKRGHCRRRDRRIIQAERVECGKRPKLPQAFAGNVCGIQT